MSDGSMGMDAKISGPTNSDTVQARLDDLGGKLERLDSTIEILEKHLGPVLRPYGEDTAMKSPGIGMAEDTSANSAIAEELERYIARVNRAIRSLDQVNERIHL